jgi:hypothetical protein
MYAFLMGLHPRGFRERFSGEMLSIFDESPGKIALLADACVSVLRQQALRPGDPAGPPAGPAPDGVPVFYLVDDSLPRKPVLLQGALLSLGVFAGVVFAVNSAGPVRELLIGTRQPLPRAVAVDRNSIIPADPTTKVNVAEPKADPWREFAETYFRIMPVLRALDTDHDYLISRAEIAGAPAALRSLDVDHDGKLSPLECGLFVGQRTEAIGPTELKAMGAGFMYSQPVLSALDADGNGEISAAEMARASASLLTLDVSHDGVLAPAEIAPIDVARRILGR